LPGLVLAICRPGLRFQLLEPSQKRRAFLAAAVRELELANVAISGERLEAHAHRVGATYDFAVSRAVFELPTWLAGGRGLVRPGGAIAGLAGREVPAGVPASAERHPYDVGAGPRVIVLVRV
jgi:16S rRNA (guanine527-N7)-methyltransferase